MKDLLRMHVSEVYGPDLEDLGPLSELVESPIEYDGALPKEYDRRALPRPERWETSSHRRKLADCVYDAIRRIKAKRESEALEDYWQSVEDDSAEDAFTPEVEYDV